MGNKQHYKWWGYIKAIIQEYPKVQPSDLSGVALREHEAVKKAVGDTLKLDGGTNRMSVISMVHWKQTHTGRGGAGGAMQQEDRGVLAERVFREIGKKHGVAGLKVCTF